MLQYLIPNIVAIFLVVLGLSYLLQSKRWINFTRSALEKPERLFPTAMVMLVAGATIALAYDNWYGTWPLFVTLLGWLLAIKGTLLLLFPNLYTTFSRIGDNYMRWHLRIGGLIILVLGALLWWHIH